MSGEVWEQIYARLAALIEEHRTTLIFVNTRRLAERVTRHLSDRLGEEHVTAHHGSMAKEQRLDAEQRLKAGKLKALVATASLELGIDIGDIELVPSAHPTPLQPFCSASVVRAMRSAARRRTSARCHATISSSARHCSTACGRESLVA